MIFFSKNKNVVNRKAGIRNKAQSRQVVYGNPRILIAKCPPHPYKTPGTCTLQHMNGQDMNDRENPVATCLVVAPGPAEAGRGVTSSCAAWGADSTSVADDSNSNTCIGA